MRRSFRFGILAAATLLFAQVAEAQQPTFGLSFGGCGDALAGAEGSAVEATYDCVLTTSDNPSDTDGAQGWSVSLSATGALAVTGITTAGTAGANALTDDAGLMNGGFEKTEVTAGDIDERDCDNGAPGAVSAVVLSFTMPITLPADGDIAIAKVTVGGTVPGVATLEYVDGCRGAGQPVDNNITWGGQTVAPGLGTCEVALEIIVEDCTDGVDNDDNGLVDCDDPACEGDAGADVCFEASCDDGLDNDGDGVTDGCDSDCPAEPCPECPIPGAEGVQIYIQAESLGAGGGVAESTDDLAGAVLVQSTEAAVVSGQSAPGVDTSVAVYAAIGSNLSSGVQGWSLSVAADDGLALTGATTAGTAGANSLVDSAGVQNGGFEKTETVDPALNGQGQGAVSAVVLSFTLPITLEPAGSATVLALELTGAPVDADTPAVGNVAFVNGMQGSGQPVQNVATIEGGTSEFVCMQAAQVVIRPVVDPTFLRGDANGDAKVDIADPIWIVNELFRGGPASGCQKAADANDDGTVDVTDVTSLVSYQFMGGDAPALPFPDCGTDPTEDELECVDQAGCL